LLAPASGSYTFQTVGDDGIRLWVNGQQLVNDWNARPTTTNSGAIMLTGGQFYPIRMEYFENVGGALCRLSWIPPGGSLAVIPYASLFPGTNGLRAEYFSGTSFNTAVLTRLDPTVNFDWGTGRPEEAVPTDSFSARWTGQVQPQFSETYTFHTISDDGVRLWVNSQLLVDNWTAHTTTTNSGSLTLAAGQFYDLKLEYFESAGGAVAKLEWSSPSQPRQIVPQSSLYLPGTAGISNTPPTISDIPNHTLAANNNTGPIAFTISDAQTPATNLTLAAASSNTNLVPVANVVFGGGGSNRTVTVTPVVNGAGTATITVTVSDGSLNAADSLVLTVVSSATPVSYGFDAGGTLADPGWTVVSTDGQGRQFFALQPPSVSSPNTTPQAGSNFVGLHIPAFGGSPLYTQDGAHNTLWIRSPQFKLNGAGDLTAWLCGGHGYGADCTGKRVADVPAMAFDDPGNTNFPSFLGLALRNANTGIFVLAGTKSSAGNDWQPVTFTAAQLLALDQNATYTLDLLDVRTSGWGWVNLDSVTIPGALVQAPRLTIQKWTANQLRIAWPASATGYTLQKSATLPGGWGNAGLAVTSEGGESVSYTPASASAQFYRLMK
jgi:hypothetical protein